MMRNHWLQIVLVFFLFDLFNNGLHDLLIGESGFLDWLDNGSSFLIITTSKLDFLSFSILGYLNFYYLYNKGKKRFWIIGLAFSLILPIVFRYMTQEFLFDKLFGFTNYHGDYSLLNYFLDNFIYSLKFAPIGIIFFFVQYALFKEKQHTKLVELNREMELSWLRAQINPHFLLNSLNNIYSLVYQNSNKSLKAITNLSTLLNYALYEQEQMVNLEKEVEALEKYIELQAIRYSKAPDIKFMKDIKSKAIQIPPFIIISIVENAFKHGDVTSATLDILLSAKNNYLIFNCRNKVGSQQKDVQNGIGQTNIKKRLKLIYRDRHQFDIIEKNNFYEVNLKIPLK